MSHGLEKPIALNTWPCILCTRAPSVRPVTKNCNASIDLFASIFLDNYVLIKFVLVFFLMSQSYSIPH